MILQVASLRERVFKMFLKCLNFQTYTERIEL